MSFRVIHHAGDKDLLVKKVQAAIDQIKNNEFKDDFDEGEWERAVDAVANGDLSNPYVLSLLINDIFQPVSDDCGIGAYSDLANRISVELANTLRMFVDGRNFSTGRSGFGDEITCGYLTPDEVREFLGLLKAYTPDSSAEDENEFVDMLVEAFSSLAEQHSGIYSLWAKSLSCFHDLISRLWF